MTKILILDLSIIIPLYNEKESLIELNNRIHANFENTRYTFEVIYVDDGSSDDSWETICDLTKQYDKIKGISFAKNYG